MTPAARLSLALWLVACGGSSAPTSAPLPPDEPCLGRDLGACLRATASRCQVGQAWRIALRDLPAMTVSASGILRLDQHGGRLLAADATRVAACLPDCPGGGGERICFPIELPIRLAWERAPGCTATAAEAPAWNGRPSQRAIESCGGAELRVVPSLAAVQRALVAVGVIDGDGPLATAPGLVVEAGQPGAPGLVIESVEPVGCEGLALPADYRVALGPDDLAALGEIAAAPMQAAAHQSRALMTEATAGALAAARAEVLAWVKQHHAGRCRAQGLDPAAPAALEQCAAAMPETEPRYAAAVARATQDARRRRAADLEAITARELIGPVCRAYAARAGAADE